MQKNKNIILKKSKLDVINFLPIFVFVCLISFRDARLPQRAIDGGLFISGEIKYSDSSLMYDSLNSSFTILHYLTALLIKLKIEFFYISFVVQFLNYLILSIALYTLNAYLKNHLLFNYLVIFIILNALPTFIQDLTLNYPLYTNSEHSYSQYGLTFSLLTISLLLNKRILLLFFTIPFFASIHIGWMLSTLMVILIYKILTKTNLNLALNHFKIFTLSVFIQVPFWIHSFYLKNKNQNNLSIESTNYLYSTFVNNWDYHRSFGWDAQKIKIHLLIIAFLILINVVVMKFNLSIKKIILIALINSLLGIILTYFDINIFNKSFILLNAFMPGKIINLSLIIYILIIISILNLFFKLLYDNFLQSREVNRHFYMSICFILLCYFFYSNLTNFNFIKFYPFKEKYNYSKDRGLCEDLSASEFVYLTIGNASRFVPLNCRLPILIDTTQIDFIPYARNSLPKLKDLMDNVFGLDFYSRKKSSDFVSIVSIPSGGIDQALVKPIWENRNKATWQYLSCNFNFKNIIVPKEISLNLEKIYSGISYNAYEVPANCILQSQLFIGDFNFNLPKEVFPDGQYFYWITDNETNLNVKRIEQSKNRIILKFDILPNPCKNNYFLKLYNDLSSEIIEVGSEKKSVSFQFEMSSTAFDKIFFQLQSEAKPCEIEGESRNLVALITNIELKYAN